MLAPCSSLGRWFEHALCRMAQLLKHKEQLEMVSKAVSCRAVRSPRERGAEKPIGIEPHSRADACKTRMQCHGGRRWPLRSVPPAEVEVGAPIWLDSEPCCDARSCRCCAFRLGRAGPEPVCPAQEQEAGCLTLGGSVLLRSSPRCSAASWPQVEDAQYAQSLHTKWEPICVYNEVELESNASTEEPMVGHVPSEDIPSEGGESPMQDKPKCNPGSAGHPELCRRPCIYFALGQCTNEADCNFCHLSHNNRSATLDKSQRQVIKQMSQHAFLSMLLQSLQSKAAEGCFELDAEDVLQLFREQIGRLRAIPSKVPKTKIMNLEKALMRMTFFSVASLTSRGSFDTGFIELCKEKVTFLRQKVA